MSMPKQLEDPRHRAAHQVTDFLSSSRISSVSLPGIYLEFLVEKRNNSCIILPFDKVTKRKIRPTVFNRSDLDMAKMFMFSGRRSKSNCMLTISQIKI